MGNCIRGVKASAVSLPVAQGFFQGRRCPNIKLGDDPMLGVLDSGPVMKVELAPLSLYGTRLRSRDTEGLMNSTLRWTCILSLLLAIALVGSACSSDDGDSDSDTGLHGDVEFDGDGSDPCVGLPTCEEVGAFCEGSVLVTCDLYAGQCIVRSSEEDCSETEYGVCDPVLVACQQRHPCEGISNCETIGTSCDEDVLVTCVLDEMGCRIEHRKDCSPMGAHCFDGEEASCGYDSCADVANPCSEEGRTCTDDTLVICAPDVYGCLVVTEVDCLGAGGTCSGTTDDARCDVADACVGIASCAAPGASCVGSDLEMCVLDAFGCLVPKIARCSQTFVGFGYCDVTSEPALCALTFNDACDQFDLCSLTGLSCDGTELVSCAVNEFACLAESRTDCAENGHICDASGEVPRCLDPCSLVEVCPSERYCNGAVITTCAENQHGCLVATETFDCAETGEACDDSQDPVVCVIPPIITMSSSPNLDIEDYETVSDTMNLSGICASVSSVKVTVAITHTAPGDLVVWLMGPDGTDVVLHDHTGGSGGISGTYPDTITPEESLSEFNGSGGIGAWTLSIDDTRIVDQGSFVSWTLTVDCS